ncbi:hypothetical protein GCM10028805_54470 [Spirosoma harenae]
MSLFRESNKSRTLIALDKAIIQELLIALQAATKELDLSKKREETLEQELNRNKLLTEQQAQEYLQSDPETIRYYRTLGLDSIKIGKDRWYVKVVVDDGVRLSQSV